MVNIHRVDYQPVKKLSEEVYVPKLSGKWVWLQNLAYKILKKFGKPYEIEVIKYSRYTLSVPSLIKAIEQSSNNLQMLMSRRAKYLIIGEDMYYKLTQEKRREENISGYPIFGVNMIQPSSQSPFETNYDYRKREMLFGLTVVVVPWVDGLFVLPDLDKGF
jgi:hypothetical protein